MDAQTPTLQYENTNFQISMITNADTGVLITWSHFLAGGEILGPTQYGMAITSGTDVTVMGGPIVQGQSTITTGPTPVLPVLQAQDGSFVGTVLVYQPYPNPPQNNMVSFDASGNVRWVVPNETPQIATADGGVIGQSGTTYDQNGGATGQIGSMLTQSWNRNDYTLDGSVSLLNVPAVFNPDGASFWSQVGGNPSENGTAIPQCPCLRQSPGSVFPVFPDTRVPVARADIAQASPPPPPTYIILEGDPGFNSPRCSPQTPQYCHNVGQEFNLAGSTKVTQLLNTGNVASAVRISSVQDFNTQLTTNGTIDGGVRYFGHGGGFPIGGTFYSTLNPGQGTGLDTNISALNVSVLSRSNLGPKATVTLNACHAGAGRNSIAQLIANQLHVKVFAYAVGMFFSTTPNATSPGVAPSTTPAYMVPEFGAKPLCFAPFGISCSGSSPP